MLLVSCHRANSDRQIHILVLRLRIFSLAFETSDYLSDAKSEDFCFILPATTDGAPIGVMNEVIRVKEIYHSLAHNHLWHIVYLPEIVLSLFEETNGGHIKEYIDKLLLNSDPSEEAMVLTTITALDSWCEVLLQRAWRSPDWAMNTGVTPCIESCIAGMEGLLREQKMRLVDVSPVRCQARILLFQSEFQLWKRKFRCYSYATVINSTLRQPEARLLEASCVAEAAEDYRVQRQCLVWQFLELKPSQWDSLIRRNIALWKSTRNTPFYLSMLAACLFLVRLWNVPKSMEEFLRDCCIYSDGDPALSTTYLSDDDAQTLRHFDIPAIVQSYSAAIRMFRGRADPAVLPGCNDGDGRMLTSAILHMTDAPTTVLWRHIVESYSCVTYVPFHLWNMHSVIRGTLAALSHRRPEIAGLQKLKDSAVFGLAACCLPPSAIVALKLTSHSNFEVVTFNTGQSIQDDCARPAIRRHLEESQERPLRYRCACCKALYPSHLFKRLVPPLETGGSEGMVGRVCQWHSGRFARVISRSDIEAPWPGQNLEQGPCAQGLVETTTTSEQVCMHCGQVQAWEPCMCECETCWYRAVPCITTYVGIEALGGG